ncbi:somatostatin-2-like [Discoglossus pictus]
MQLVSSVGCLLLLVVWSVSASSQPEEDKLRLNHNQELSAVQEDLLLKLLSGWVDNADSNSLEMDREISDPLESKMIPHSSSIKFPHVSIRERKAPCKHFFWKTFTAC